MDRSIEEIKADVCAFLVWAYQHGEYVLTNVSSYGVDRLSDAELIQLATRFAHERTAQLWEDTQKVLH